MLLNLHKKKWTDGLILKRFDTHSKTNEQTVQVPILPSFLQLYTEMIFFLLVDALYLSISFVIDIVSILVQEMLNLAIKYNNAVQEEDELPPEKLAIANVGRQDAKKHLEEHVSNLMSSNIVQTLGTMLDTVVFQSANIVVAN